MSGFVEAGAVVEGIGKKDEINVDGTFVPFDTEMDRTSTFIPNYLSRLIAMVAMKEDTGKAKIIRNAVLRELRYYIDKVEHHNGGPYDSIGGSENSATDVAGDAEIDEAFIKKLYADFVRNEHKFPQRIRVRPHQESARAQTKPST